MKMKALRVPILIFVIALIASVAASLLTCMKKVPTVTEHDFSYSVTYKLDGEVKTFEGVYKCRFDGFGEGETPVDRYYVGEYTQYGLAEHSYSYAIAQKNGLDLCVVTVLNSNYLMNDANSDYYEPSLEDPYLLVYDQDGYEYTEGEQMEVFDAEIISWEYPEPVDNSFVFVGFSGLHIGSMLAMILVGVLTIIACVVFVKKDPSVTYTPYDKAAVIFNFAVGFLGLPLLTMLVVLMQLTMSGFGYQVCLCIPPVITFCIAASIALRRKGFSKTGFYVQVALPGVILGYLLVQSVIYEILNAF